MAKSLRLDQDLEDKLAIIARITGDSQSESIRKAIRRYADEVLDDQQRRHEAMKAFVGMLEGPSSDASTMTGKAFGAAMAKKHDPTRRRPLA